MVFPKIALVLSLKAFRISSSSASGFTKLTSIPNFFSVDDKRVKVPPYRVDAATICSPLLQIFKIAKVVAVCPADTARAPTPPSN